jgi:cell division protein FtsI (penicillin-binding protein 3)
VIGPETVAEILPIMEAVVESRIGTAAAARIPGFTVAGKTGTADKLIGGRYSQTQQNVSFVGFVPSRDPAFTMIVMIDSPRDGRAAGGRHAAPIFKRIAEATLRHMGIAPTVDAPPPIVIARRTPTAITPTAVSAPAIVSLAPGDPSSSALVPDLRGLSARDALRTLARLGVTARLEGAGVVIEQTPAAGMPLERGTQCVLQLARSFGARP